MPFSDPGSLAEETYRQVTAFLIRQHELERVADLSGKPITLEHQGSNRLLPGQSLQYIAVILFLVLVLLWVLVKHIPRRLIRSKK